MGDMVGMVGMVVMVYGRYLCFLLVTWNDLEVMAKRGCQELQELIK
jgi:hypothetical protein